MWCKGIADTIHAKASQLLLVRIQARSTHRQIFKLSKPAKIQLVQPATWALVLGIFPRNFAKDFEEPIVVECSP